MASFNGEAIFGGTCRMVTASAERERQINGYFGLQGTESLDGGFRHRITTANGMHLAESPGELIALQELFRSYEDERAYILVDTRGVAWSNVLLLGFNPTGEFRRTTNGGALQAYTATFHHLSYG